MIKNKEIFLKVKKSYLCLGLKSIDILILSQIEEFQRNGCTCYMSNKQFSEMFGESESTVKRSIDKLEQLNMVNRKTNTVSGNGQSSKQRIMTVCDISEWNVEIKQFTEKSKVQKSIKQGSNNDIAKVKNTESTAHNEPIKNNIKENIKYNSKNKNTPERVKEKSFRNIEDLSYSEGDDICIRLKKGEKYIDIAKLYSLKIVTKDFPSQWDKEKRNRAIFAEQERELERRKSKPYIDYSRIYADAEKAREKEREEQRKHDEMFEEMMREIFT